MKTFQENINNWLEEVSNGCHEIAIRDVAYPDFYVFQSTITNSPDILYIGANPGGNKSYQDALKDKNSSKRTKMDLAYPSNQYLDNPNWAVNKPFWKCFLVTQLVEN